MDVGEKRDKSEAGEELDRISALPVHLRESILDCLPVKDAMRNSVLSTSWRYCWTGMRQLDLEQLGFGTVEVFRKRIDRILLLHSGPIHKIKLFIPDTRDHSNVNLSDWFHVLSKKGIQVVLVNAYSDINEDFPLLPCSLFQCRDLKRLSLSFCELAPPPNFTGFHNLIDLGMVFCVVPSHLLGSLISQCPLLEKLSLIYTCMEYTEQPLVISALNLRTFRFEDDFLGTIIFKNVPKLNYVSLLTTVIAEVEDRNPCNSLGFLSSFPRIEELVFDISMFKTVLGCSARCLPTRLENLKTLTLIAVDARMEDDIRLVICLIRSSPALQDLTICFQIRSPRFGRLLDLAKSQEDVLKLLDTEARENCNLSNVSTIEFRGALWSSNEFMLVKLMLSHCPNIKSFKITPIASEHTEDDHPEDVIKRISGAFEELPNKDKLIYC